MNLILTIFLRFLCSILQFRHHPTDTIFKIIHKHNSKDSEKKGNKGRGSWHVKKSKQTKEEQAEDLSCEPSRLLYLTEKK